jgi:hypothetical protein
LRAEHDTFAPVFLPFVNDDGLLHDRVVRRHEFELVLPWVDRESRSVEPVGEWLPVHRGPHVRQVVPRRILRLEDNRGQGGVDLIDTTQAHRLNRRGAARRRADEHLRPCCAQLVLSFELQ